MENGQSQASDWFYKKCEFCYFCINSFNTELETESAAFLGALWGQCARSAPRKAIDLDFFFLCKHRLVLAHCALFNSRKQTHSLAQYTVYVEIFPRGKFPSYQNEHFTVFIFPNVEKKISKNLAFIEVICT